MKKSRAESMEERSNERPEAQRCLGIAEKLLTARDLIGSKNFAVRAQKADPFLDGVDQILAIIDVLLAAEKRINNHLDWYAILQLGYQSNDLELIKRKYKRLALLLHPDKNKSVLADNAFKLVVDAWAVLSNPSKKTLYDNELNLFSKLVSNHNVQQQQQKQTVRRSPRDKKRKATAEQSLNSASNKSPSLMSTFWTTCPYCYNLYEYPRVYEECCLRCEKCKRAFHAVMVTALPPAVPGEEEFFYCWGFFPLAFSMLDSVSGKPKLPTFPNRTPSPHLQSGGNRSSADKKAGFPNSMPFPSTCSTKSKANSGDQNSPGKAKDVDTKMEEPNVPTVKPHARKKTVAKRTQKQKGRGPQDKKVETRSARQSGGLDLNGELGSEVDDSEPGEGTDAGSGDEDVAAGIGFFEGLDDFLEKMPILNVVNDGGKVEGGVA